MNGITGDKADETGNGQVGAKQGSGKNVDVYCYSAGARAKGEFQVIDYNSGEASTSPAILDPAALAVYQEVGVVLEAITEAGYVWIRVAGICDALVDGTEDVAKGDYLESLAAISVVKDHSTVRSVNSVAVAMEAQTVAGSATLAEVEVLPRRSIVAGS